MHGLTKVSYFCTLIQKLVYKCRGIKQVDDCQKQNYG